MDIDYLKYLIIISKSNSLSQAAKELYMTPQALSIAMKKLEDNIGMKLLNRTNAGVSLTENGQWLMLLSKRFFDEIDLRKKEYNSFCDEKSQKPSGKFTFYMNTIGLSSLQAIDTLYDIENYSDLCITITEAEKEEIIKNISEGILEVGGIFRTKINGVFADEMPDNCVFFPIQEGELAVLAKYNDAATSHDGNKRIYLKKLLNKKFLFLQSEDSIPKPLINFLNYRNITYEITNSLAVYKTKLLLGKHFTFAIKTKSTNKYINKIQGLDWLLLKDDIKVYFGIVYNKYADLSSNTRFILHYLLQSSKQDILL